MCESRRFYGITVIYNNYEKSIIIHGGMNFEKWTNLTDNLTTIKKGICRRSTKFGFIVTISQ